VARRTSARRVGTDGYLSRHFGSIHTEATAGTSRRAGGPHHQSHGSLRAASHRSSRVEIDQTGRGTDRLSPMPWRRISQLFPMSRRERHAAGSFQPWLCSRRPISGARPFFRAPPFFFPKAAGWEKKGRGGGGKQTANSRRSLSDVPNRDRHGASAPAVHAFPVLKLVVRAQSRRQITNKSVKNFARSFVRAPTPAPPAGRRSGHCIGRFGPSPNFANRATISSPATHEALVWTSHATCLTAGATPIRPSACAVWRIELARIFSKRPLSDP